MNELNTIILSESRGDYVTGIHWNPDGKAEVMGGTRKDAIRYSESEAAEVIDSLGRGYIAESE